MSLLKEIATYSARPFFTTERDRFSLKLLLRLTFLAISLAFLVIIVVSIFFRVLGIEIPDQSEVLKEIPQTKLIFLAVVAAPLLEETIFRSWLGSRAGIQTALPIIAAIFFFYVFVGFSSPMAAPALVMLSGVLAFYFSLIRPRINGDFIDIHFKYYFWASTLIFALIHLSNYDMETFNPAMTLLILPQLIAGFVFGYARMRFGLLACMLTHGSYNGTIFLLMHWAG